MILDIQELELLKLCAISRYVPCGLAGKYEMPLLKSEVAGNLVRGGYLKYVNGSRKCIRLTRRGRDVLLKAGYEFSDDARPHKKGDIFDRRMANAELNALLHGSDINIYAGSEKELSKEDCVYIPSLTMRADKRSNVLAGTRFYGILRIRDTAYVIYYIDKAEDGIFSAFENDTFSKIARSIENVKHIAIIIATRTVEGLCEYLMPNEKPNMARGRTSLSELMEKWHYNFYLLPMDKDGIMQMKMMCIDNADKKTASLFGDTDNIPVSFSRFNSVCEGKAYIYAMDMNITRVRRALEQSLITGVIPNIICFAHQREIYQHMAVYLEYPQQMKFTIIRHNKMAELFPKLLPNEMRIEPARTKDGEYLVI